MAERQASRWEPFVEFIRNRNFRLSYRSLLAASLSPEAVRQVQPPKLSQCFNSACRDGHRDFWISRHHPLLLGHRKVF